MNPTEYQQMMDQAYQQQSQQDPLLGRKMIHHWGIIGQITEVNRDRNPDNPWVTVTSPKRIHIATMQNILEDWRFL